MGEKFQQKYQVSSPRLSNWDYGSHGLYFVTICIKDRIPSLSDIMLNNNFPEIKYTPVGLVAHENWLQIPLFHPYVELDEFVIMPDHMHGILFLNKPNKISWEPNKFGGQSHNLASIVIGYKASVKNYALQNDIEFSWQPRYYDRVIRDKKEHENIRQYIYNNPVNWLAGDKSFENFL